MTGLGEQINNIDEGELLLRANQPLVDAVEDDNPTTPHPNGPMHWTPIQSGFMLRRFHDLVGQGSKPTKGSRRCMLGRLHSWSLSLLGSM